MASGSIAPALAVLAAILMAGTEPEATETAAGPLPAGAISSFEIAQVTAEICRRMLFPPAALAPRLPDGYRLARLSDRTAGWAAELVRQRPDLAEHARGSFCFIEAGLHEVDGRPIHPGRRSRVVVLWADIEPVDAPPADRRFRGEPVRRAQLLFLYDLRGVDRDAALAATPNARFGRIAMTRNGAIWTLRLDAEGGRLAARVAAHGPRRRLDYPTPGYETFPLSDDARDLFTVVTFAGHHEQEAAGDWRASGEARWLRLFGNDPAADRGTFIQDGWTARSALFRFGRADPR